MMIETIEGGQKRCLLIKANHIKKWQIRPSSFLIFWPYGFNIVLIFVDSLSCGL